MARYTDTQEFSFGPTQESRTLIVKGSVTINAWDGAAWILSDTVTTGTRELFTKNTRLQFIPDVAASYYIDEEGDL